MSVDALVEAPVDVLHVSRAGRGHVTDPAWTRHGYGEHLVDPVPITQSLDRMMKSLRGTDRRQVSGVFGRWDDAVGEQVAAHVRPLKLDQRTLVVEADTTAWATQVKFLSDTIITRLHEVAGVEIERLEVRVAGGRRR